MKHRVNDQRCPICGAKLDAASNIEAGVETGPSEGDGTFCVHCLTVLVFDARLNLKVASDAEREEFLAFVMKANAEGKIRV